MFVCIENKNVTAILNYQPNVPADVSVVEISDSDYQLIVNRTHYFNTDTNTVISIPQSEIDQQQIEKDNIKHKEFLSSTDWMVLRHIRQKALAIPTSLTEAEYLELEEQRQTAASSVR